jgi:hypothetical protein
MKRFIEGEDPIPDTNVLYWDYSSNQGIFAERFLMISEFRDPAASPMRLALQFATGCRKLAER